MSNQMRKVLVFSLVLACLSLGFSLTVLFIRGEFLSVVSWISIGLSLTLIAILLSLYSEAKKQEKELRGQISYYRLVHKLREKAILDFYHKFGIPPQYNKDGKLMTPDEYLGILTKLDEKGCLDPSIYEMLGIMPKFDENGKEIPRVLVLKHLIRAIKKEGLTDIPKLKGLYKKGTKKEVEKKPENKKAPAKKEEKKAGGGKSKGDNKIGLFTAKRYYEKPKNEKKGSKKDEKKGDKDEKPKENLVDKKAPPNPEKKEDKAKVEKVFDGTNNRPNSNSSYLNNMWKADNKTRKPSEKKGQKEEKSEEVGEATFE